MAWIDRLLDYVPGTPEGVGAWAMSVAVIGAGVAVMLANLPLAIAASGLSIAGALGPALYSMKRSQNSVEPIDPIEMKAKQDAAVAEFVEQSERVGRFQAMVERERRLSRSRFH